MDKMMRFGFLCGITAACFLMVFIKRFMRKDNSSKCRYDERQQIVRGRGFQYGFFGWMIFNAVYIMLDTGFDRQYMDTSMALFSGIVIGVLIYVCYTVWNEGYFSLNIYPKRVMSVLAAATVLNIICGMHFIQEGILIDGVLTFLTGSNVVCAAASLIVFAVIAVKWFADQRKEE